MRTMLAGIALGVVVALAGATVAVAGAKTEITSPAPFSLGAAQADVFRSAPGLEPYPLGKQAYTGQVHVPIGGGAYPGNVIVQFDKGRVVNVRFVLTGRMETANVLRRQILASYAPSLVVKDFADAHFIYLTMQDAKGSQLQLMASEVGGMIVIVYTGGGTKLQGGF